MKQLLFTLACVATPALFCAQPQAQGPRSRFEFVEQNFDLSSHDVQQRNKIKAMLDSFDEMQIKYVGPRAANWRQEHKEGIDLLCEVLSEAGASTTDIKVIFDILPINEQQENGAAVEAEDVEDQD